MRILIIDANEDWDTMLIGTLDRIHCRPTWVQSAAEGQAALLHDPPDLVIVGATLPDAEIVNVIGWIREQETLAHLPIIAYLHYHDPLYHTISYRQPATQRPDSIITWPEHSRYTADALRPFADSDIAAMMFEYLVPEPIFSHELRREAERDEAHRRAQATASPRYDANARFGDP